MARVLVALMLLFATVPHVNAVKVSPALSPPLAVRTTVAHALWSCARARCPHETRHDGLRWMRGVPMRHCHTRVHTPPETPPLPDPGI